jgi:copper(I)-binding protein
MKVSDRELNRWFANVVVAATIGFAAMPCAAQQVTVKDAWARATVAGQKTAGAYVELTSASGAVLVGAASPVAEKVELHNMSVEGGIMRMRPVQRIELPARKAVKLAPGGLHLMLIGVSRLLRAGDKLPLVLTFEVPGGGNSILQVEAEVRAAGATGSHHH